MNDKMTPTIKTILKMLPLWGMAGLLCFASCKKDNDELPYPADEIISPTTGTRKEFTLDSLFLYARQLYRWQEALPDYAGFDPRNRYGSVAPEQTAYERALYDITQYAKRPDGQPYEWTAQEGKAKYSYLERYQGNGGTVASTAANRSYATHLQYWQQGAKSIAYLYIASFPDLSQVQSELDAVFAELAAKKVTHLILDLRDNGGGYVRTAEHLANLIAPASLTGRVMFSEQFNSRVQEGKATILQFQPYLDDNGNTVEHKGRMATMADVDYSEAGNTKYFKKLGELQSVAQVSFIVSGRTASAAELLISSLKPHLSMKLIGQPTYGKPIGFFPIRIDQYQVYLSSFLIRNADGWSDYFDGIPVDIAVSNADSYPIGDPNDPMLRAALQDIGVAPTSSQTNSGLQMRSGTKHSSSPATTPQPYTEVPIVKEHFSLRDPDS